jgi:hypothetical protein
MARRYSQDHLRGAVGQPDEGIILMSNLVAIEFPSEAKAEEVRQKLLNLQPEYLIKPTMR